METVKNLSELQKEERRRRACVLLFSMHYFQAVSAQQIYYDLNATISQVFVRVCVCATCLWLQSDRKMRTDRQTERMRVGDTCVCVRVCECVGVDAQCWQLPSCRLCDNTLLNTEYYMHAVYMPWYEYVCLCVCM